MTYDQKLHFASSKLSSCTFLGFFPLFMSRYLRLLMIGTSKKWRDEDGDLYCSAFSFDKEFIPE